jgi:hypothetical protein
MNIFVEKLKYAIGKSGLCAFGMSGKVFHAPF